MSATRTGLSAYLRGVGLWTPVYPSYGSWRDAGGPACLDHSEAQASARPAAELLHPRLRRRTSTLTRASVTALEAAVGQAGADLDAVRFVLVSSFGEIETTVELLAQLADPQGPVSPTKFHNSVHNTATGYMSIASGNHREATALAGGAHNLEIAALELLAGLAIDGGDAVLLVGEERLPEPFARPDSDPTFAAALLFGAEPARSRHPSSLDLRVELVAESSPADAPDLRGAGLASMVPPVTALLQAIAELEAGPAGASASVELGSRPDPFVAQRWGLALTKV
jgi:hypothetical protein